VGLGLGTVAEWVFEAKSLGSISVYSPRLLLLVKTRELEGKRRKKKKKRKKERKEKKRWRRKKVLKRNLEEGIAHLTHSRR